jgi:hypothetical protein
LPAILAGESKDPYRLDLPERVRPRERYLKKHSASLRLSARQSRVANDLDRGQVAGSASDNLKGLFGMLPILRTGEAIVVGEAVSLPIRTLIDPPDKGRRPDSSDPLVVVRGDSNEDGYEGEGGWAVDRHNEDYAIVMRQWRKQSPHYEHKKDSAKSASPGEKKS